MPAPRRIASLLASATEMLYAMGLGDRVVAVSHECDWPPEVVGKPRVTRTAIDDSQSSRAIDEQVQTLAKQGAALYEVDEARLVEVRPDLIATQAQCDVCAVRYEDVVEAVSRHAALRDTAVFALNPMSLDDILTDIKRLGQACGAEQVAAKYRAGLIERRDRVARRAAEIPTEERPRAALIEWIEPLMLSGNWMPELVEMAGGRHGLTEPGAHSPYVNWQTLAEYDPQVIVIMPCGFALQRTIEESERLPEQPGWHELSAVRSGRVFAADGNAYFNRSGPRIVDSLEILAHLLHPRRFAPPESRPEAGGIWRRMETAGAALVPAT